MRSTVGDGMRRPRGVLSLIFVVAFASLMFSSLIGVQNCLFSTDNNIGAESVGKAQFPEGLAGSWFDSPVLGSGVHIPVCWLSILHWLLPLRWYVNWIHAIDVGLASLFLTWFLRRRGVSWAACALGWLAVYWVGSNFTLVYAGHTGKFGVLMFAAIFLLCVDKGVRTASRVPWAIVGGSVLGLMFLEQQDLALFFALCLGSYLVFRTFFGAGWRVASLLAQFVPMGIVTVLIAGATTLQVYVSSVRGTQGTAEQEDRRAKWEFVTQWSVPPDESIDLIAPNYFGIRSGEPEGPYWGRTGRSAGWEQTRQGFMNFRLESIYIGAIPVVLALFAVVAALRGKVSGGRCQVSGGEDGGITEPTLPHSHTPTLLGTHSDRRAEILFWGAVALITLLLAYGKYFPLYALFYQLPVVNNIRCPNKFLQPFQLALGILAAYGVDCAVKWYGESVKPRRP